MSIISSLEEHEVTALRDHLLSNFEAFSKFAFKIQTGTSFLTQDYHSVMFDSIQMAIDGKTTRLAITIPPRGSKTQLVSVFLPLYAWVKNPHGHSILTGFNGSVLQECTGFIRTIMSDPDFKRVFPDTQIDMNKKSVEKLGTMSGGVIHAVPTSGALTGKGCGSLTGDFSGLMVIDDVIKPDNANSPVERNKINDRYSNTLLSRLATEDTPLIIIMQRLHSQDLLGFLFKGGSADTFDWLNIPGIVTKETGSEPWYQEQIDEFGYTNVRPILYELHRTDYDELGESSFWPIRKSIETLRGLRTKDPYTFYSQYMGMPVSKGTETVSYDDLRYYDDVDSSKIKYTFLTADTASTTETYSDYSVACLWGVDSVSDLYLLDVVLGKWKVPDLIKEIRAFWRKHNVFNMDTPTLTPRGFYIEDKSSGLFLNQQFLSDGTVTVRPVPRDGTKDNDKFSRFLNTVPYFKQNRIYFPRDHEHIGHIKREVVGQTELGNQTGHDDFVDNVSDAVAIAYSNSTPNYEDWG